MTTVARRRYTQNLLPLAIAGGPKVLHEATQEGETLPMTWRLSRRSSNRGRAGRLEVLVGGYRICPRPSPDKEALRSSFRRWLHADDDESNL